VMCMDCSEVEVERRSRRSPLILKRGRELRAGGLRSERMRV
jgi:hypothetical protein